MHTNRKQLFSAAAVFAIAIVVGAWTTSTRGGGEDMTMNITALLDGYENPPTKLEGTLCIAHASITGQTDPVSWDWSSTYHYNANQRQIQDYLGYADEWQLLEAWDDVGYDSDQVYIDVDPNGETCEG